MMTWVAEKFERLCSILMVIIFISSGVCGAFFGWTLAGSFVGKLISALFFFIVGILIALIINISVFGYISQIIKIRKNLEELYVVTADIEGMLENTNFDKEITEIKVIVKNIEEKIQ